MPDRFWFSSMDSPIWTPLALSASIGASVWSEAQGVLAFAITRRSKEFAEERVSARVSGSES